MDIRKKTEHHSWDESSLDSKCASLEKNVLELKKAIEEKDHKIDALEKQLNYIVQLNSTMPTHTGSNSPI